MAFVRHTLVRQVKATSSAPYPTNAARLLAVSRPIRYDLINKVKAG